MKSRKHHSVTLEELIALNDEIIALVRAGIPLELGLSELGEDRTGMLGRLASRLAARLNRGESLPEALGHEEMGLPYSYRMVVEAGLRAGRLTAALEGISEMAWKMAELRRRIGLALVYPLIVLMLAYGLFLLLCVHLAPRLSAVFYSFRLDAGEVLQVLIEIGQNAWPWGWIPPLLLLAFVYWWWRAGKRGFLTRDGQSSRLVHWCPGVRRIARLYRYSHFADLLALLIENDVPLSEALILAADTTGDPLMQDAARAIAEANSSGQMVPHGRRGYAGFPPFLHWLITRGEEQKGLVSALRAAADMYRRRAVLRTEWLKVMFPVAAAVIIGGGATLIYTLTVFWPVTELLRQLAEPAI